MGKIVILRLKVLARFRLFLFQMLRGAYLFSFPVCHWCADGLGNSSGFHNVEGVNSCTDDFMFPQPAPEFRFVGNYVINLDRHASRLRMFERAFHSQGILFDRVPASDGVQLHTSGSHDSSIFDPQRWHAVCSKNTRTSQEEVGKIYSHVRVWQMIANRSAGDDFELRCIFEDGVRPIDDFKSLRAKLVDYLPRDQPVDMYFFLCVCASESHHTFLFLILI